MRAFASSLVLAALNFLRFADGWTLVCLYGGGGHQATPNACCVCWRGAFGRVRRVQTLMTLFTDAGFTYTIPWLTALCNDLQIHVERKDAAFAAAEDEPLPAPTPAAKPAKPAKAERSPFCDSLGCCGHCSTLHRAARSSALRRRSPRPSRAPSGSTSSASRSQKRTSGPDAEGLPHSW